MLTAESFHEPLTVLAMKMLVAGMDDRATANMLRGLMQNAAGEHDPQRWQDRYDKRKRRGQRSRSCRLTYGRNSRRRSCHGGFSLT